MKTIDCWLRIVFYNKLVTASRNYYYKQKKSQLTFTCSNSTIKTPEKDVKYDQS